jgi:D-glycero-alpha-D-manno-heptose 1-phosphate guanylyltransferase
MYTQEAIILAGGKGTRLTEVVDNLPKVMAPVNGRPFLEYVLDHLHNYVIEHVVLSVGFMKEAIMDHFGSEYRDIRISYAIEEEPLGTGGGIKKAFGLIRDNRAFVINGDTLFRLDLIRHFDFHTIRKTNFSVTLREVEDVSRYGAVEIDADKKIIAFREKGEKRGKGYINGGVYLINKRFFEKNTFPDKFSIEKDCLEAMVDTGQFYGLVCRQYFIDIGIPADYEKAQHDFEEFAH